jgi:hypothetical protein
MTESLVQRNIDVIIALIGIAAGIGISCLNFIYSNEYLITMGPMLAIVCLVYIIFRRKLLSDHPTAADAGTTLILVVNIVFWISFAGSIYSLSTEILHRPVIYFLLSSLSASMIAVQIIYCRGKGAISLVIFEILLLSVSIRASAFWVFPTIPGIDSWEHMVIVLDYVTQGHIVKYLSFYEGLNYYYSMPMMHLNVASMQIVTGVDYKAAMFLGASLPLLLSTVFVFLIGQALVNAKVGLLAMLLLNLSDYHIRWGAENIIAMSLGIALFTIIVYLLIRDSRQPRVSNASLVVLFMIVLVLTHTISSFIMACFLLMVVIGSYLHEFLYPDHSHFERSIVTPTLVAIFMASMLVHWMYAYIIREGLSFFEAMTSWYYGSITEKAELLVTRPPPPATEVGWLGPIVNISGYLLLLLWGIVGCLIWLSWRPHSKSRIGLIAALVVLIGLPLSFPLFGIEPTRWPAFYYVILSIPVAVGVLTVINCIGYQKLRHLVLVCLMFAFSFIMITNSVSNTDSPVYTPYLNERLVYTESEIAAGQIMEVYDGPIISDARYGGSLKMTYHLANVLSCRMLDERGLNSSLVLWRDILSERPVVICTPAKGTHLTVLGKGYEQKLESSHNLIYINKDTKAFLPRGFSNNL